MGQKTGIQWTDATFNPWWGCTKVSRACRRCYAATFAARWVRWGPDVPPRELSAEHWRQPLRWSEQAKREGVRRRVFCASMADVFERRDNEHGPTLDRLRARLWELIEQADGLDWQLLTKRPEKMQDMAPAAWRSGWPRHVWAGATVENQDTAEERIPHLLAVPAAVRFLSCEPLTGPIKLTHMDVERHPAAQVAEPIGWYWINALTGRNDDMARPCPDAPRLHWLIAGGESGPGAEPSHPDWFRSLRDQCERASVPFFFKQWGDWQEGSGMERQHDRIVLNDGRVMTGTDEVGGDTFNRWPEFRACMMSRVGKAAAGRELDGREHNALPPSAVA